MTPNSYCRFKPSTQAAQLQKTLEAEEGAGDAAESLRISGESGGGALTVSEMGLSATAHGKQLLNLGFSVDQVVHDYGDLCQAITDLAFERDAPFSIDEFRTLNRCLDNAIASAVSAFSFQRDAMVARKQNAEVNERVGVLVHELRNSLATASLTSFIAEARNDALLYAQASGCRFTTAAVDPALELTGDHTRLLAALGNLLQNAFKFSRPYTEVTLSSQAVGDKVSISVHDRCGGLAPGYATTLFKPFSQRTVGNKSSLGLGLSIARASVEADGGTLNVQDVPGVGCVFTISLPRYN